MPESKDVIVSLELVVYIYIRIGSTLPTVAWSRQTKRCRSTGFAQEKIQFGCDLKRHH